MRHVGFEECTTQTDNIRHLLIRNGVDMDSYRTVRDAPCEEVYYDESPNQADADWRVLVEILNKAAMEFRRKRSTYIRCCPHSTTMYAILTANALSGGNLTEVDEDGLVWFCSVPVLTDSTSMVARFALGFYERD